MNNKLIVFEGIDGVGKSTLCALLERDLRRRGIPVIRYESVESEKRGYAILKPFIKKNASVDASFLFYLSSAIYKSQAIEKLLRKSWVLCDRYVYSTIAYHSARGVDVAFVRMKELPIRKPDVTFCITVKESIRMARILKKKTKTPEDLRPKRSNNTVGKMESYLKKSSDIVIDNSQQNPKKTLEKILVRLGLSYPQVAGA